MKPAIFGRDFSIMARPRRVLRTISCSICMPKRCGECFAPIRAQMNHRSAHGVLNLSNQTSDSKALIGRWEEKTYNAVHTPTAYVSTDGCEAFSTFLDTGVTTMHRSRKCVKILEMLLVTLSAQNGTDFTDSVCFRCRESFFIDSGISVKICIFAFFAPVATPTSEFGFGIARLKFKIWS